MSPERVQQIKSGVATLQQEVTRAEGSYEQLMKSLKSDFNINTVAEGLSRIEALELEQVKADATLASLYSELEGLADWDTLCKLA